MDSISVLNTKLEVEWHGPPPDDAVTLIFLHEGLGSVSQWRDFPEKLSDATGCGSLVYSRRGYGGSAPCNLPRPLDFMHHEGLKVLPELIKTTGIKKCILIGHSDGGSIALIYGGGTPALPLNGIITEAAHLFCEEITIRSIREAKIEYDSGSLRTRLMKHHGENTDCAFRGWNDIWLHPEFINWNIEEYLPDIKVPILAIQGKDDKYGTMAHIDSIINNTGGNTRSVILKNCGHSPHKDQEEAVFNVMIDFIWGILKK